MADAVDVIVFVVGVLVALFFGFAFVALAVSLPYYDYDYFPDCDEDAPAHLSMRIMKNDDAKDVASRARDDGWTDVHVDNGLFFWATVSGDCHASSETGRGWAPDW